MLLGRVAGTEGKPKQATERPCRERAYRLHASAMHCHALFWLTRPDSALSYHERHGCELGKLRGAPWRYAGVCPASQLDREPDQGWQPCARRPAPQSAGDER